MSDLHKDPWMMERVNARLEAIRYAEYAGLETALDLLAFADEVLEHYAGPPEKGKAIDVRFTFEEDDEKLVTLVGIERARCDLTDGQTLQVGEDWAQSDRYSVGYAMDLIGVVSDGDSMDYREKGPRTW